MTGPQAGTRPNNDGSLTVLDKAYTAMMDGGDEELLHFYRTLLTSDLYLLLEGRAQAPSSEPKLVQIEEQWYVMVFDTKERVQNFVQEPTKPMKLPGRWLINLLNGRGTGIALNLGDNPSAMMIPSDAVDWVYETITSDEEPENATRPAEPAPAPAPVETANAAPARVSVGKLKALMTPQRFPSDLESCIKSALAPLRGNFVDAMLVRAEYDDGASGYLLAFTGADETHQYDLAQAISGAIKAAAPLQTGLDVTFLDQDDASHDKMHKISRHLVK